MVEVIAGVNGFDGLAIAVKAASYALLLIASGSVLCPLTVDGLPLKERRSLYRFAAAIVPVALALIIARLMLEAVFLAGDDWAAALDPGLLALVANGALGQTLALQAVGGVLIAGGLIRGRTGTASSLIAVVLIAVSFTLSGHVSGTAEWHDEVLLVVHMLCLSFWVGVLLPLYRLSGQPGDAAAIVAEDFGRKAIGVVAVLVVAGLITLNTLTGGLPAALQTAYGQLFAVKLGVFALVLLLAAINRRALTPALISGRPGSGHAMRRSLVIEASAIGLIVVVSATFTTLTGPGG
ncbi:copper resistance D family protein [Spiribacter vilamensis]|uniref:Copper resistance protein D n=1 Tax=Spiribacter vilamensis TaxID=531306 RepID=A0A4Q8CZ61_9GAMM|nr:CopD family protein [Spiribacter vilamensis]RZU98254.1 putative copper resistance protein D [Spiribacter vilamensis]TVO60850.1 copper-binding protein [Spiribacter vilamensis]